MKSGVLANPPLASLAPTGPTEPTGPITSMGPTGPEVVRVSLTAKKSLVDAYILGLVLGFLGAHHFYLRRPWFGIAYLFTFGLLGVGYIVDLFRMPCLVREANNKRDYPTLEREKNLFDAYIMWFPFGLLGFHLFYLRKPGQGVLYFCTFGLLGIGFLVDLFRIPSLVREANDPQETESPRSLCGAYILGATPLGILGVHHYYIHRPTWGLLYTFSLGLGFVGWIYDWFRMPVLVKRCNAIAAKEEEPWKKHLDDIYILWFPFGFLGLHHFYLNRPGWGVLYLCTFGLLGVGWLVDFCRLPCLVADYNKRYREQCLIAGLTQGATTNQHSGSQPGAIITNPPLFNYQNQSMGSYPPPGYQGEQGAYPPAGYQGEQGAYPPPGYQQEQGAYPQFGQQGYSQGYPGVQGAYPSVPGHYLNHGYEAGPPTPSTGAAVPPVPPTYEESISCPEKSAPPLEVKNPNTNI